MTDAMISAIARYCVLIAIAKSQNGECETLRNLVASNERDKACRRERVKALRSSLARSRRARRKFRHALSQNGPAKENHDAAEH